MPGADDFAAFDHSLPQGSAAMQADIVHGAECAVHVGDADGFIAAGKFLGFVAGREFGFGGDLREAGHESVVGTSRAWLGGRAGATMKNYAPLTNSIRLTFLVLK